MEKVAPQSPTGEQPPKRPYQEPAVRSTKLYETFVLGCVLADENNCGGGPFGSTP